MKWKKALKLGAFGKILFAFIKSDCLCVNM